MTTSLVNDELRHAAKAVRAHRAIQRHFKAFLRVFPPDTAFTMGTHTAALCGALQAASDGVLAGERSYTIVVMPPQHGKSALASRRFAPWHLIRQPAHEVILVSYSGQLATDFSHDARRCFSQAAGSYDSTVDLVLGIHHKKVNIGLDEKRAQVAAWRTQQGGGMYAVGLGGTVTGRGGDILIVDDYLRNREEAESQIIRDKIWDSFRNDLITRMHAAHAVVIPCTRWHEDDLVGRILRAGEERADFPKFKVLRYPALSDEGAWLWPEMYSAEWYEQRRAAVGTYAWQALYQGDPQPRRGNLLAVDQVRIIEGDAFPKDGIRWARGWDLASTAKQRTKDDPDYTVGIRCGLSNGTLYVLDVQRGQWATLARDSRIEQTVQVDGPSVRIGIEAVAGYKDTAERLKRKLSGVCSVQQVTPDKDKVARAAALEPLFESGNVILKRAPWNEDFLAECRAFPSGRHDDQVDALTVAYAVLSKPQASVSRLF